MALTIDPVLKELRDRVRAGARNAPGTYRFLSAEGEVLYVGKSKRVRTRLLSYFRAGEENKAWRLIREAREVEWAYEPSEFASLLRELELIKQLRPRFNVRHKRDGLFSFLKLSPGPAPRLFVVRRVGDDQATYFGPFRGGQRIVAAVRELNDALGMRDCGFHVAMRFSDQRELFMVERTPGCHRFEIGRCLGPCVGGCTETEYLARVALARAFLDGDGDEPIRWLARRMEDAAERWEFERAASLRDRVERLEMLRAEFGRLREALENLSFVYRVPGEGGADRAYVIRRGSVRAVVETPAEGRPGRRLLRVAREIFHMPEPEGALVSKHQVDEILLVAHWFRTRREELARTLQVRAPNTLQATA